MSSDDAPLPSQCPDGYDEVRIADLLSEWGDAEAHVMQCRACAERYLEHVTIEHEARALVRESSQEPVSGRAAAPRRGLLFRLPRGAVAASLIAALAGVAIGAAVQLFRTVVPVHTPGTLGRVSEMGQRAGVDLAAAGLDPDALVVKWHPYVIDRQELGTLVAANSPASMELSMFGFGADGQPDWDARRVWPDGGEVLGRTHVECRSITSVVSRRTGNVLEETFVAVLGRNQLSGVFVFDPKTGVRRGASSDGGFYHHGGVGAESPYRDVVSVLPAPDGVSRNLLVYGFHAGKEARPVPCAVVFSADGTVLQHVMFPVIGIKQGDGVRASHCEVDWSAGREKVRIDTTEHLLCEIRIVNGLLEIPSADVRFQDDFKKTFNLAKESDTAFDDWLAEAGGSRERRAALGREIQLEDMKELRSWDDR